jgi:hypothetical protein
MNIEFHYYALYYIARNAGFADSEASTIAIASQMVDDCVAPWEIRSARGSKFTSVTQNYRFWDESVAEKIYRPFHFLPGDVGKASRRRRDGRAGPGVVTEDSTLARELLISALKARNLFRIGIALHAYADTWAHQNFSADLEPQNALEQSSPVPPVGHLHALKKPDNPRLRWRDPRLEGEASEISNSNRFAAAATMIYRFLCTYQRRGFLDASLVVEKLESTWSSGGSSDSAARASDYIVDLDVPPYERNAWPLGAGGAASGPLGGESDPYSAGYDRFSWLQNAAARASTALGSVVGFIPEAGYFGSPFERWNLAVEAHRAEFARLRNR